MATTRSTPSQKDSSPVPGRVHRLRTSKWVRAYQVRYTVDASTNHTAYRRSHRRTTTMGPPTAIKVVNRPNTATHAT
jgi:hypothetical protein